jgi:hypothetical protein
MTDRPAVVRGITTARPANTSAAFLTATSASPTAAARHRRPLSTSVKRRSGLFDQFQRGMPRSVLRRRTLRSLQGLIRHHRIAQGLQFGIRDPVELHPKLQDGDRDQMGRFPAGAGKQIGAALLEGRQRGVQFLFRTSHWRLSQSRACEIKPRRSRRWFHGSLHTVGSVLHPCAGLDRPPGRQARPWRMWLLSEHWRRKSRGYPSKAGNRSAGAAMLGGTGSTGVGPHDHGSRHGCCSSDNLASLAA